MRKLCISIFIFFLSGVFSASFSQNWLWAKSGAMTPGWFGQGYSVSTDAAGNVFFTGFFLGPTLTFGTTILNNASSSGSDDIFIVKYDPNGNVLWAKSVGGIGIDRGYSVSTDIGGNVFITGYFCSTTITFGSTTLINSDPNGYYSDVFIAKYDPNGNVLWAKSAGQANYSDGGLSLSSDVTGNVFVTGYFDSPIITFGLITLTNAWNPNEDIFILKYDSNGNILWAKSAGGSSGDYGKSVSADAAGNVFVAGSFNSPSITFGTTTLTNAIGDDVFITKYDANGNVLWAKSAGGPSLDEGNSVSADPFGNVFITGSFESPTITFGSTTLNNNGWIDLFITKYDANGNVLWAKSSGGTSDDEGWSLSADTSGNVFVTGEFYSTITFGTITLTQANSPDPSFIAKYDANGNVLCASALACRGDEISGGISADRFGNAFLGSAYDISPFNVGSHTLTLTGSGDVFITKYFCACNSIVINVASQSNVLCNGDSSGGITVVAASGNAPYSYSWSPSGGTNATATGLATGTYTVIVTDANGCTSEQNISITQPPPIILTSSSTQTACNIGTGTATINSSGGTPGYNYNWNPSAQTTQTATGLNVGNYTVIVTDSNGCTQSQTINISQFNSPTAIVTSTPSECVNNTGTATTNASGGTSPYTYSWNNSQTNTTAINLGAGNYTVVITDANGCTATQTIQIINFPDPIINISNETSINFGSSTTISASGGISYNWSPSTNLSCSICANPTASPTETTTYCVTVTDTNGCTNSACVTVDVVCDDVFVPSAFSPNGDGQNDFLFVRSPCIQKMDLKIFDRLGEKVFESNDINEGWDGNYKGEKMNNAVFVYFLKATFSDGKSVSKKGDVSLIR